MKKHGNFSACYTLQSDKCLGIGYIDINGHSPRKMTLIKQL